jgi:hypothetical protein
MITLFFAELLDYSGNAIMQTQFTASAKHSAFIANEFAKSCPPCAGFKIRKQTFLAKDLLWILITPS